MEMVNDIWVPNSVTGNNETGIITLTKSKINATHL
jgi:SLT domain-containing protein